MSLHHTWRIEECVSHILAHSNCTEITDRRLLGKTLFGKSAVISTALAVLFTLVDSGIDVYTSTSTTSTIDSFDCSKLFNIVEPVSQWLPV